LTIWQDWNVGGDMHLIGQLLGALVATFLLSRLVAWALRSALNDPARLLAANVATLAIATVVGGYGFASGGSPLFATAFRSYFLPVIVWLIYDVYQWKKRGAAG
jgi:hypothetical protein